MIIVNEWIKEAKIERTKHLDLNSECIERGGNSTIHRGVLAQYLNTDIPFKIDLCHACNNGKCSNPKHLYWGTRKENTLDAINNGTHISPWISSVKKHGYENACKLNSRGGKATKGISKTKNGSVVELADTQDLKSCDFGHTGSTPVIPTINKHTPVVP